ncbi:MAG: hypothetical protein MRY49_00615 [Candidatus Pacebacteria bacterium]|nr:hypothetical protein [Candidatus Paceibacterota bacterium]
MKINVYFRKASVHRRLEKGNIPMFSPDIGDDPWRYGSWGPFFVLEKGDDVAYCSLKTPFSELPALAQGLKPVRITLHTSIPFSKNRHIRAGHGAFGNSEWSIDVASGAKDVYRVYIDIKGTNLQSVITCYEKIRAGQIGGTWMMAPTESKQEPAEATA